VADGASADQSAEAALQKLRPLLRPDKEREARIILARTISKFHSGPIPSAEELEHLDRVLPGAANRCFELAEREQAHRHDCERTVIKYEFGFRGRGQWLAIAGLVFLLAIVAYLAFLGDTKSAAGLGAATIVGVVTAFTAGKYIESKAEGPQPPAQTDQRSMPAQKKQQRKR
jgi:uncharacterized membrane protein